MTTNGKQDNPPKTSMPEGELLAHEAAGANPSNPSQANTPGSVLEARLAVLAHTFDNAPDGIQVTNLDGHILYANRAIERIYGFTMGEQEGKPVSEMNAEPGFAEEHIIPSLNSCGYWDGEVLVKHKDGRIFPIWLTTSVVKNDEGKPIGLMGITRDITKSKQGEVELFERDAKYRSLVENMTDGFAFHKIVVDEEGRPLDYVFLDVNEAFERLTGLKREEIINKRVTKVLPGIEQDPADWISIYGKVALEGEAVRLEQYAHQFDKWYSVAAFRPMKDHFMTIFEDITERKKVEMALSGSEKKYRKFLELANDAIFVADAETGILVEANRAGSQLIGRPISEIVGKHQSMLHPPEKAKQYGDIFMEYVAKNQGVTMELLVRHASGRDIPAEISSSVFKLGEKLLIIGIFRDLTARNRAKELSDKLNEVNSIINSTLKFGEVVGKVLSTSATAIVADSAAFFLLEGDNWILEKIHGPSAHEPGIKIPYDVLNPPPRMVENPAPVAISDAQNDDRANKEMARKIGLRSLLLVPLVSDERVLGLLVYRYFTKRSEFTLGEIDFGMKLGASISLALKNARLFSGQQNIASALQKSLLVVPESLPHIRIGHIYRSASDVALVGGDFYDYFPLHGNKVGVVIGDVSGKGLDAAVLTSTIKHTIKGYAFEGHSPGAIMSKTNIIAMQEMDSSTFATAFVGMLDTQSGVLTYFCAGHPPPIIKRQNGDIDILETGSPPLGVLDFLECRDKQVIVSERDLITLYTDGVIEARCASDMFGENRLVEFLRNTPSLSATEAPEKIFSELIRCRCKLSDDIAIVSLSIQGDS